MRGLAQYSLSSGVNVVLLTIALQLKWLAMRDKSRAIPFVSTAAHTSHAVRNCSGASFWPHLFYCSLCNFIVVFFFWHCSELGCALPPAPVRET